MVIKIQILEDVYYEKFLQAVFGSADMISLLLAKEKLTGVKDWVIRVKIEEIEWVHMIKQR